MEVDQEEDSVKVVRRDSDATEEIAKALSKYIIKNEETNHDLIFLCDDGSVPSYQVTLILSYLQ